MYEKPDISKLNYDGTSPTGLNDYIWMVSVAVGQEYVLAIIAGVFFQTIFQIDTSYPVSLPNNPEES